MSYRATICRLALLTVLASAGCALSSKPRLSDIKPAASDAAASQANAAFPTASPTSTTPALTSAPGQTVKAAGGPPDPRVLDDVLAELATLGPIQPEAQQRLIDDLRKTDPAYWPMLVQTMRASLAYRRRAAQREAEAANDDQAEAIAVDEHPTVKEPDLDTPPQHIAAREPASATIQQVAYAAPASTPPQSAAAKESPPIAAESTAPVVTSFSDSKPLTHGTWQQHLAGAIDELERETREHPQSPDALANQIYLRLLDLTAGRRDDALRPIPGISTGEQDYWSKQLFALSTYLDRERVGDPSRRAGEASLHLAKAVAALGEQGPLMVRNLAFCTAVHSYGVLKRVEPAEFKSGQPLLVYAEVENFKSEESPEGFHTSLLASYQILDGQGRRMAHDDLPHSEEHCQNRRRDFFLHYFINLPKTIYEGTYTLELTIEDKLARKIGQSTIEFSVKEKK